MKATKQAEIAGGVRPQTIRRSRGDGAACRSVDVAIFELYQLDFGSVDIFKQIAHLSQQSSRLPMFLNAFTRITSMLECILVSPRRSRSGSSSMHPAAFLSAHRWRPTGHA